MKILPLIIGVILIQILIFCYFIYINRIHRKFNVLKWTVMDEKEAQRK